MERCLACEADRGLHPRSYVCHDIERGLEMGAPRDGSYLHALTGGCRIVSHQRANRCRPRPASAAAGRQRSTGCDLYPRKSASICGSLLYSCLFAVLFA